jgi:hypothetical protein
LQFHLAVKQPWQPPGPFVEDRLGILGCPAFVAAPQVSVGQAVKEEKPTENGEDDRVDERGGERVRE